MNNDKHAKTRAEDADAIDEDDLTILDILLDPDNQDPIDLMDETGKKIRFDQVAVIPHDVDGKNELYAVLKPLDKVEGVADDEVVVFRCAENDDGEVILKVEENNEIAEAVFNEFYELVEKAKKGDGE